MERWPRATLSELRGAGELTSGPRPFDTLLVHISGEHGHGWTTLAIDRATREWSIAQRHLQSDAAKAAYTNLYT